MIISNNLTMFSGAVAFAFAFIYVQIGIVLSILYAIMAMVICRGLLTFLKRWLILSDRIVPEKNQDERTIETNRAIFWRGVPFTPAGTIVYSDGALA